MSDVERIAQDVPHFPEEDFACPDGCDEVIDSLRAALARRDAAIQAVQELRDSCLRGGQSRMFYNRALTAIAIELEKP